MKLPILYHKAKGGDLRQWRVWSQGDSIMTEYGQVGGKLQVSEKKAVAKNIGRSNATNPIEQAKLEAESLWRFKVERKYSESIEDAQEELRLPMLAHKYEDKKKHVIYPAYVQPKLDGVRCIAQWEDNKISLTSRQGKPWTIPTVQEQLAKWLPKDMVLDGELYRHGMSCQKITSFVKKWRSGSEKIIYNVYDVPVVDGYGTFTWEERLGVQMDSIEESTNISIVPGFDVNSYDEVMNKHSEFVQDGYEGAILRMLNGIYQWGYRSSELLKVKEFQDSEFIVIDAKSGRGKMEEGVIWICQNDVNDLTFDCTIKATMEDRRQMFTDRNKYIGKKLTVRYQLRTDDNKPRFPVGIVFRDEKDL